VVVGPVAARYVAVADGLHSPLRRALGLQPGPRRTRTPPRYGLRRHFAVQPWSDHVEVHWGRDCEAYVTPVAPREVGVAVLCGGGEPYERWLTRFPALLARLDGAVPTSTVRGAGPLRQRATGRARGRALLVGDAAGYVDALTGEGLAVGFAGADALLECVTADRPRDYERSWRRVTRRPRLLTEGLLQATRVPALRAALVPAARGAPQVFDAAVRVLA
jgi:flavin-dependent dehydrogenase